MRTIKAKIIWLDEFRSYEEAREDTGRWIEICTLKPRVFKP